MFSNSKISKARALYRVTYCYYNSYSAIGGQSVKQNQAWMTSCFSWDGIQDNESFIPKKKVYVSISVRAYAVRAYTVFKKTGVFASNHNIYNEMIKNRTIAASSK